MSMDTELQGELSESLEFSFDPYSVSPKRDRSQMVFKLATMRITCFKNFFFFVKRVNSTSYISHES